MNFSGILVMFAMTLFLASGLWSVSIENSTNTYMAGAYYNNTLIGQLKQGITGTC